MADLRGGARDAPPGAQILSISCSFGENLAKSYVGAPRGVGRPLFGETLDPPLIQNEKVRNNVVEHLAAFYSEKVLSLARSY